MAFFVTSPKTQQSAASLQVDHSTTQHVLAVASGSKILIATVARTSQDMTLSELAVCGDSSSVQCAAVSHSGLHFCVTTDNKNLATWRQTTEGGMPGWSPVGTRVLTKRPMALCFTADEKWIVMGDKTGEVYRYPVEDIVEGLGQHLLGHFSMLLDMVLSPSNSHLITCDRDEKIRVSKFPNSYNIETFCLAHTEFVSSLCVCPTKQEIVLSGSGDGTVKAWHWREGRLLDSWEARSDDEEDGDREGVVKVCCSSHDLPVVVVALERQVLRCVESDLMLPTTPWDVVFDWSEKLWVCLHQSSEPVLCFKWEMDRHKVLQRPVKVEPHQDACLSSLCKWEHFEGLSATSSRRDWSQLRKQVFDNVGTYLARKEERIQQSKKGEAAPSNIPSPPATPLANPPPASCKNQSPPPCKKTKTDVGNIHI